MKKIRIAALAVAACGLMVACNNNAPAELVDTVVPIDTMVVEELIDTMPVVDTPALGGRDVLYPEEFVRRVEAVPEALADGIAHWGAHRPAPWKVRAGFLEKAAPHRERFRQLMRELTGRSCGRPPHKLGLRTPHPGVGHTLAIQAYLLAKGIMAR